MLCPMKFSKSLGGIHELAEKLWFCEKEKCAWWDNFYKQCAIVSISTDICCLDGKNYSKEKKYDKNGKNNL